MVLWPDFWSPSFAPDLFRIAPEAQPPRGTVESGQMVIHKRRCWRALLLTLFLNCQGSLYYNLLTNYMGVGDKETFPMAMRMLQQPYHAVGDDFPVGSAGLRGAPRRVGGGASLQSTCMVQYHPATGAPLLFHSNLNKWRLNVPTRWAAYRRRWSVMVPPGWRFVRHHSEDPPLVRVVDATASLGYDVERACWEVLVALRCAPWFEAYIQQHATDAAEVERVFEYSPEAHYNSFVLDDHMTGRYEPVLLVGDDGIDDHGAAAPRGTRGRAGSTRVRGTRTAVASAQAAALIEEARGMRDYGGGFHGIGSHRRSHDVPTLELDARDEDGLTVLPPDDDGGGLSGGARTHNALPAAAHAHGAHRPHDLIAAQEEHRLAVQHHAPREVTPETRRALEAAFLQHGGRVMEVAEMEELAASAGVDLVTLYIWWDARSKVHPGGTVT